MRSRTMVPMSKKERPWLEEGTGGASAGMYASSSAVISAGVGSHSTPPDYAYAQQRHARHGLVHLVLTDDSALT